MSKLPIVAIIGRPNTGKSTLFNALTGSRRAIVNELPGTTRDPVVMKVETDDLDYLLLDTGGLGGGSKDIDFEKDVAKQSTIALQSADLILFTLDARTDLTASDQRIIEMLRKNRRRHVPVIVVATKCDKPGVEDSAVPQFEALGIGEAIIATGAVHRMGINELEETIIEQLKELHFEKRTSDVGLRTEENVPRIAIVGRPNVGKSSILNALMSEPQRKTAGRIVSDIPGTTRDTADSIIMAHGKQYMFIDTAGLRRKARVEEDLEFLSTVQAIKAMQDSDIVILVLDATEPPSHQDKRIAGMAIDEGKGLILLANKADLLNGEQKKVRAMDIAAAFPFCRFAPTLFVSAVSRDGLLKLFPLIDSVTRNRLRRIATKDLREWYLTAVRGVPSRALASGKHITQAAEPPPTFVLFVKNPRAVQVAQLRYLENNIRQRFGFEGTPIRWVTKEG